MTLPLDVILDLHQDGLRVHVSEPYPDELRLTGPYGEQLSLRACHLPLLRDMLAVAHATMLLRATYAAGTVPPQAAS